MLHLVLTVGEDQWIQIPFHVITDDMQVSNLRGIYRIAEGQDNMLDVESRHIGTLLFQPVSMAHFGENGQGRPCHGKSRRCRGSGA